MLVSVLLSDACWWCWRCPDFSPNMAADSQTASFSAVLWSRSSTMQLRKYKSSCLTQSFCFHVHKSFKCVCSSLVNYGCSFCAEERVGVKTGHRFQRGNGILKSNQCMSFLIRITERASRTEDSTVRNLISQGCFGRQEHEQFITWHVAHAA